MLDLAWSCTKYKGPNSGKDHQVKGVFYPSQSDNGNGSHSFLRPRYTSYDLVGSQSICPLILLETVITTSETSRANLVLKANQKVQYMYSRN